MIKQNHKWTALVVVILLLMQLIGSANTSQHLSAEWENIKGTTARHTGNGLSLVYQFIQSH